MTDEERIKKLESAESAEDLRKALADLTDEDRRWLAEGGFV